jgi:hypothetical protein
MVHILQLDTAQARTHILERGARSCGRSPGFVLAGAPESGPGRLDLFLTKSRRQHAGLNL